ncbi:MAG TPA: TIGR03067 domain-containing protein [Fimbriiglobus sp.]|nr:TIGR03067 domain-containing protein [Fimbriiglobus sp.]
MTRIALGVVVFVGAAALSSARDDQPRTLDGTYAVKSAEKDGEAMPAEELKKIVEVVIKDDVFTMKKEGSDDHKAKLKLDATKKPAEVDVTPQDGPEKDKTLPGIYKVEKDELTFVVAREGDRPKDFDAKGKGIMKIVLQKKGADK